MRAIDAHLSEQERSALLSGSSNGPYRPLPHTARCCDAARQRRHSLHQRNQATGEFTHRGLSRPSFSYFADAAFVYTRGTFCSALHHLSPDRSFAKVVSIRTKNLFSLQTDPANDPVDKAPMLCRVGILLRPSFCRSVHCSPRTTIQYQPLRLALKSRWAHSSQVILAFTKGRPQPSG